MSDEVSEAAKLSAIELHEAYSAGNSLVKNLGLLNSGGIFLAITFLGGISQRDASPISVDIDIVRSVINFYLGGLICSIISSFLIFLALNADRLHGDSKGVGRLQRGAIIWFVASLALFCVGCYQAGQSFSRVSATSSR